MNYKRRYKSHKREDNISWRMVGLLAKEKSFVKTYGLDDIPTKGKTRRWPKKVCKKYKGSHRFKEFQRYEIKWTKVHWWSVWLKCTGCGKLDYKHEPQTEEAKSIA